MSCDVPNGGRVQIIVMNPFDPNRVRLEVNIPNELGKKTIVASFNIKEAQPSFSLRETNNMPFHKSRFAPQCISSLEEVTADTGDSLDHKLRERKNIQPKLNHAVEDRLEQLGSPCIAKIFPQPTMDSRL